MLFNGTPLSRLQRFFESRNTEETYAFLREKELTMDVAPRDAPKLDFTMQGVYLPGTYLGVVRYGAAVDMRANEDRKRADYWLHIPVDGTFELTNSVGHLVCDGRRASVSSPDGHLVRSSAGSTRLTLSIPKSAMMDQLAALLGEPPQRSPEFDPEMDLESGSARSLIRYLRMAIVDLHDEAALLNAPIMKHMYEQLVLTGLLLSQPHSYATRLQRLEVSIQPRDVKRASDYIESHLDRSITLADLVRASGVPGRTLLKHFKEQHGVSPMQHLRNVRFARARDMLLCADPDESVTAIALTAGFQHLGRFAVEYRQRFGESPSDTLRSRSRRRLR